MRLVAALVFAASLLASAQTDGHLGRAVCAGCHKEISATQAHTAMAQTWQGLATKQLPAHYSAAHSEGSDSPLHYVIKRAGDAFSFQLQTPGGSPQVFPIETLIGGQRHGISFLLRMHDLDGLPLPRAPLIEARYLHYAPRNQLAISAGFPEEKPVNLEAALGRVLSPEFEKKCLTCHGQPPAADVNGETGVSCEGCHGSGQQHLVALGKRSADKGILNPAKLPIAERMKPCSQCHAGFSKVEDPLPGDLLISDQVTALSNSECWRQSAGQITCTSCHSPHQDAPRDAMVAKSEKTCLQCHGEGGVTEKRAGFCPVNATSGCVGCHMPTETRSPFEITDHWIRVLPGQPAKTVAHRQTQSSQVVPRHLYLRMIALSDPVKAAAIRQNLVAGESFFELARVNSTDSESALKGGFLGDLDASHLDPSWASAVLKLQPGELSDVIPSNGRFLIFQRPPRTFREDAELHFNKAMDLRKQSKRNESIAELLEALKIYPHLLRALTYLGITQSEGGNAQSGSAILGLATSIYPQDAGAHFNLGIAYGALRNPNEIQEYKRALALDPDLVLAYLNWGGALYGNRQYKEAAQVYRNGLNINPLNASLHYSLGVALEQDNDPEAAKAEFALARKLDPTVGSR